MFLGIEIGGTKLQLGVGTGREPAFAEFRRLDVDPQRGAAGILEQIERTGRELAAKRRFRAVGFGFGGPIDASAGTVTKSHQVAGWVGFPLAAWTRERLGVPAFLGNDCDMAALAEARFGAGRDRRSAFYVTVGTGVGGGLVIDGRLHGAGRPAAAEIGHLRPGLDAVDPSQTVESMAAGPGIEAAARDRLRAADSQDRDAADLLERCGNEPSRLTAKAIAQAALDGNALAAAVMDRACRALGWGIAQAITLLAIEVVIVGGGVSLAGDRLFYEPLRAHAERYVFPPLRGSYAIVGPQLGEQVVVHGAVAMAADSTAAAAPQSGSRA